MKKWLLACLYLVLAISLAGFSQGATVIAHRGASGYLPEHTLPAYAYAHALRADFVELDLVMTKDNVLICLHDIYLEPTTDVELQYPERSRRDGHWYAADFTVDEVRTLHVHERTNSASSLVFPDRFPLGQSSFFVPTLVEAIELVQGLNRSTGRDVGLYPELKRPSWHSSEGLPIEEAFLEILTDYGYSGQGANIIVQCFEADTLRALRTVFNTPFRLVQLVSASWAYAEMWTESGLDEIAQYADGIGPSKTIIEGNPSYVSWAHARGLIVHPYTFRADSLPADYASLEEELETFYFDYGVDGVFTDFPDAAIHVLARQDGLGAP